MPRASLFSLMVCYNYVIAKILLLGEIMLLCSRCDEKGLVYITISSPTGCQLLLSAKYTKMNIHSLCNVCSAFNAKYILLINLCSLLIPYSIYYKVLYLDSC